jgi:hypothetical protein
MDGMCDGHNFLKSFEIVKFNATALPSILQVGEIAKIDYKVGKCEKYSPVYSFVLRTEN